MLVQSEPSSSLQPFTLQPFARGGVLLSKRPGSPRDSGQRVTGIPMSFARNAEIFGEGEAFTHVYRVVSGAVRTSKLLPDGRRQISAFHLPGDIFGFEPDDIRNFSAEAIVATKVVAFRWQGVVAA